MSYPRYRFHQIKAPDGLLVASADTEPTGEGWVDTPQAFDPSWTPPPPDPPELRSVPGLSTSGPRQFYPSWRFAAAGQTVIVESAAEDVALGPGWYKSPADVPEADTPPVAEVSPTEVAASRRAELYAGTVPDIVARVSKTDDRAALELWRSYEDRNPKGARKGVITAIVARLAALVVPEEE